jgi:hypothetical protein
MSDKQRTEKETKKPGSNRHLFGRWKDPDNKMGNDVSSEKKSPIAKEKWKVMTIRGAHERRVTLNPAILQ